MTQVNLGLGGKYLNKRLLSFLSSDVISKLPLEGFQIDELADKLNWDIMSSKELPGWIMKKYSHLIDWNTFLQNGKPKDIHALHDLKSHLYEHQDLFFNVNNRNFLHLYYNNDLFICMFPEFVDWNWCSKYKKLNDFILLKFWTRMRPILICKHQDLSEDVMREKNKHLKWRYVCSNQKLSEKFMTDFSSKLDWLQICKYQKLSEEFITQNKFKCSKYHICRYQTLTEEFIAENKYWVDLKAISQFQNLSIKFIHKYEDFLDMEFLAKNKNYNKPNTIQVIKSLHSTWFIIEPSIVETDDAVIYCSA